MKTAVAATAAAMLIASASARAQDFQLPPGTPSPAPGPTDTDVPAPVPRPAPTPTPSRAPVPAVPAPSPSAARTPSAAASPKPSPQASPRAAPSPRATPVPTPTAAAPAPPVPPAPSPSESPVVNEVVPMLEGGPTAVPTAAVEPPAAPAPESDRNWLLWLAVAGGALLLALVAFLVGRRSARGRVVEAEPESEPLILREPLSSPPPAEPAPATTAVPPLVDAAPEIEPAPASVPLPQPSFASRTDTALFDIELVPQRMTLALINASLTYRLTILNRDHATLGPLRISCDLISAHASLQMAEQLEPDPEKAWLSHDFEALPPGEHLVVDGEVRLPRAEILPVHSGSNLLFVPLIRFTVQTLAKGEPEIIGARVFVIGEEPDQPGAPLKPFRLNDGTRSYSRIGQREVTIAP